MTKGIKKANFNDLCLDLWEDIVKAYMPNDNNNGNNKLTNEILGRKPNKRIDHFEIRNNNIISSS